MHQFMAQQSLEAFEGTPVLELGDGLDQLRRDDFVLQLVRLRFA
jgi:hypothetical protein